MDFAKLILNEKGAELTSRLVGDLGFGEAEARSFLGKAVEHVSGAIRSGGLDLAELFSSKDPTDRSRAATASSYASAAQAPTSGVLRTPGAGSGCDEGGGADEDSSDVQAAAQIARQPKRPLMDLIATTLRPRIS